MRVESNYFMFLYALTGAGVVIIGVVVGFHAFVLGLSLVFVTNDSNRCASICL